MAELNAGVLATLVGRSRFAVHRAFRGVYDMAPSDYQRQVRLRRARSQLTDGLPIAEVAAAVGFADQAHLTRWFKRYYGVTPGEFRAAPSICWSVMTEPACSVKSTHGVPKAKAHGRRLQNVQHRRF
jgi:AraC-like DNA-binding protein